MRVEDIEFTLFIIPYLIGLMNYFKYYYDKKIIKNNRLDLSIYFDGRFAINIGTFNYITVLFFLFSSVFLLYIFIIGPLFFRPLLKKLWSVFKTVATGSVAQDLQLREALAADGSA